MISISYLHNLDTFKKWSKDFLSSDGIHKYHLKQGDYYLFLNVIIHEGERTLSCALCQFNKNANEFKEAFCIQKDTNLIIDLFKKPIGSYIRRKKLNTKQFLQTTH